MNVLACYKVVYEEQDIVVGPDGKLSFDRAEIKPSLYDLNAIEEGSRIAAATGGTLKGVTVGDKKVDDGKLKKGVLSRGPEEIFLVMDDSLADTDTNQTATALAAAAKKIGFDLILCGEGSSDYYSQQVGIQLGEILGLPVINAVSKITVEGDKIIAERSLESDVEVLEIPTPAVICVTSDINEPKVPSMKDILAAGKKPVTVFSPGDLGVSLEPKVEKISVQAPKAADRKLIIIEGDADDKVAELFEHIKQELK